MNSKSMLHEEYAELWRRVVAFFIDVSAVFLSMYLMNIIVTGSLVPNLEMNEGELIDVFFLYLILFLGMLFFYINELENRRKSGTFGKRFMKIKIVDLEGNKISLRRGQLRQLGQLLTCLTLFIGFFSAAFTKEKRTLHDRLSGTKVVKK